MHAKKRNGRVALYRSHYVRKGADGNTHGYPVQKFVGSLPASALDIPANLAAKLSPEEVEYVEQTVIAPARRVAEQATRASEEQRRAMEARERDPRWRLDEALRLLADAGHLVSGSGARVDVTKVRELGRALEHLTVAANVHSDPLEAVVAAVASATKAVRAGHYGKAPASKLSDTSVYRKWRSIAEAVDGGESSLLRALQAEGWVLRKS